MIGVHEMIYIYFGSFIPTKIISPFFLLQTDNSSAIHVYTFLSSTNQGGRLWDYLEEI